MCLCCWIETKMADELDLSELDRVRISAAELRVEASSFVNHGDVHRGENDRRSAQYTKKENAK